MALRAYPQDVAVACARARDGLVDADGTRAGGCPAIVELLPSAAAAAATSAATSTAAAAVPSVAPGWAHASRPVRLPPAPIVLPVVPRGSDIRPADRVRPAAA